MKLPLTLTCLALASMAMAPISAAEHLSLLSSALSPRVAYDASLKDNRLQLIVETDAFGEESPILAIGLAADQTKILTSAEGKAEHRGRTTRWTFEIPAAALVKSPAAWKKLRMGAAVEWPGRPGSQPRQRERFLHQGSGAPHTGLSNDPLNWRPLDLEERARQAADRELEIAIDFTQPLEGKATLVIESADGTRVRNLISGQTMAKGTHRLLWDGLDENGKVAAPGDYRWRSISHPGLKPVHLMDFCDGPGSNHGTFQAAATNGASLFFASPVAEGGFEIIELDADGNFRRGFNPPHGHGLSRVALAADERYLYVAHDGLAWGQHVDRSKPDWKEERTVSVVRFDLEKGELAEFPDKVRHSPLFRYQAGPGSGSKHPPDEYALAGMTLSGGKLHLVDRIGGRLVVVTPESGKVESEDRTGPISAISSRDGVLYIISDRQLMGRFPAPAGVRLLAKLDWDPSALWAGPDGNFYIGDSASQSVRVLDGKGKTLRSIGTPGGIAPGIYDPLKLQNPGGLVELNGKLWVTERDRWQPKRLAAFDVNTGQVVKEYFGPTNYGAQGASFDDQDATRWIGQGALWQLDLKTRVAKPVSILGGKTGRRHTFWRQDGRTFVITSSKATWIQELLKDGTLKPLACLSSAHQFSYEHDWKPPQTFVTAFNRDYPQIPYEGSKDGRVADGKPGHGYGMLWVDRNGDTTMDAEEMEFSTTADSLAGAGWSHDFHDLTLRVPATRGGKPVLVTLAPEGWWPGGAPKYPALNDAVKAAVEIDLPGSSMVESITDRFGNTVMNSDPAMRSVSPEGKLRWTYPNRWSNVHGSHKAPLPKIGELQGSLFYSGMAPLDESSDVMLINGNHGRAFVMTSDGLYVDEMFPDVRMMTNPQAGGIGILGGECFGGTFGRSKDGNYYFQGGGISYRIYRVEGLRSTTRNEGKLAVSGPQALAAARNQTRVASTSEKAPEASIPWSDKPQEAVKWDKDGNFPVSIRAARDGKLLRLQYEVADTSPWVNHGKDWQSLFKTGDGVDLQLGLSQSADPRRTNPAEGDLRLFIAPMGEENVAVLYRHRFPQASANEAVNFQSPWRSEKVDQVKRLESAIVKVQRGGNGYKVDVGIPLADLGLENPKPLKLRGDFGVIYGDAAGTINTFRNYWSNQATGLVSDVPGEIMLSPNLWGHLNFSAAPGK